MSMKSAEKTMQLKLNKKIYPLSAVLHTCSLYSGKVSFKADENGKDVIVHAELKKSAGNGSLKDILSEFQNELINQALRLKVAKENKKVRELIIEQALCASFPRPQSPGETPETLAQTDQGGQMNEEQIREEEIDKELEEILREVEAEDYREDPLGIAVPWEEKYGKEKRSSKKNAKSKRA